MLGFVGVVGPDAVGACLRTRQCRRQRDSGLWGVGLSGGVRLPAEPTTGRIVVRMSSSAGNGELAVMVNGVPGGMATETAEAVVRRGLRLLPNALTGPDEEKEVVNVSGVEVQLVKYVTHQNISEPRFMPSERGGLPTLRPRRGLKPETRHLRPPGCRPDRRDAVLQELKSENPSMVVVDFTHPTAANPNVKAYCAAGIDFVIGTTGGSAEEMRADVQAAPGVHAVIAPNMGKQIVAFQAMIENFAKEFPGVLSGYTLDVVESHQSWKADTSGTAKAVIGSMGGLGVDFSVQDVEKVRNEPEQLDRMKVPMKYLKGHAYHTYTLTSPDGTVTLEFKHNVRGRRVYAEGTVDAVVWLAERRSQPGEDRIFNMIDILRSGKMQ